MEKFDGAGSIAIIFYLAEDAVQQPLALLTAVGLRLPSIVARGKDAFQKLREGYSFLQWMYPFRWKPRAAFFLSRKS